MNVNDILQRLLSGVKVFHMTAYLERNGCTGVGPWILQVCR